MSIKQSWTAGKKKTDCLISAEMLLRMKDAAFALRLKWLMHHMQPRSICSLEEKKQVSIKVSVGALVFLCRAAQDCRAKIVSIQRVCRIFPSACQKAALWWGPAELLTPGYSFKPLNNETQSGVSLSFPLKTSEASSVKPSGKKRDKNKAGKMKPTAENRFKYNHHSCIVDFLGLHHQLFQR